MRRTAHRTTHFWLCKKRESGLWSEGVPGHGEGVHLLQAGPQRLSSRVSFRANDVATQTGDQADHVIQSRGRRGKFAATVNHLMYRLPFTGRQNNFTVEIRTFATQTTQVHHTPGHDRINRKTVLDT